jgi:hypothetical protein
MSRRKGKDLWRQGYKQKEHQYFVLVSCRLPELPRLLVLNRKRFPIMWKGEEGEAEKGAGGETRVGEEG